MEPRVRLVAILASLALLLVVLELVRRRRLLERYALLWLLSAVALIALAASSLNASSIACRSAVSSAGVGLHVSQ